MYLTICAVLYFAVLAATRKTTTTTSTTTSTTTACTNFIAQATSGTYAGYYLNWVNVDDGNDIKLMQGLSSATPFYLTNESNASPLNETGYVWFQSGQRHAEIVDIAVPDKRNPALVCTAVNQTGGIVAGAFSCEGPNGNSKFSTCPPRGNTNFQANSLWISRATTYNSGCVFLDLIAIPSC